MSTVNKWIPVDPYDITAIESWLADMARNGCFLYKFHRNFAEFEKGEPQEARYRLEPAVGKTKKSITEMKELFEKNGWEYITAYRNYFHIYASADDSAKEPHTDPVVQSYTYDAICRHAGTAAAFFLIATLAVLVILAAGYLLSDWPVLLAVGNTFTLQLLLILTYVIAGIRLFDEAKGYRKLRTQLKNGFPLEHEKPYKKSLLPRILLNLAALATAAAACAVIYQSLTDDWTKELPSAKLTETLPDFCLLEDLEGEDLKISEYVTGGINQYNTITYNWSWLAPLQYKLYQSGAAENRYWKDGTSAYSPSLQIEYYKLRFNRMADPLLNDLISRFLHQHNGGADITRRELSAPGLDRIVLFEDSADTSFLFCRNGKIVIMMQYYGEEPLSEHLEQIAEMAAA